MPKKLMSKKLMSKKHVRSQKYSFEHVLYVITYF